MREAAELNLMTGNLAELTRVIPEIVQGLELPEGRYGVKLIICGPLTVDEATTYLWDQVRTVQLPIRADDSAPIS
ncbi:MAG TPA: hypothetical protein VLT57_10525 [Bryobacteraceae bacterium]|nr:hypothetical protein [Bryobacteraceae bacterium]